MTAIWKSSWICGISSKCKVQKCLLNVGFLMGSVTRIVCTTYGFLTVAPSIVWHMTPYDKTSPHGTKWEPILKRTLWRSNIQALLRQYLVIISKLILMCGIHYLPQVSPEGMLDYNSINLFTFTSFLLRPASATWGRTYSTLKILNYFFDHLQWKHIPFKKSFIYDKWSR